MPAPETPRPLYTSRRWLEHFAMNARRPANIPWETGPQLDEAERRRVADSIRQFQIGESGEGRRLKRCAAAHGKVIDDAEYADAIAVFIAEEQRHSAMLARYLTAAGEPLLTASKVDGIFRWLRHLMGIELSLIILSTAEVVATVYYRALRDATGCPVLKGICKRILRDEAAHLAFHRDRFLILRAKRSLVTRSMLRLFHHGVLMAALVPVWWCHGRVFRAGGISPARLAFDAHRRLHQDLRRIGLRARLRAALLPEAEQAIPIPVTPTRD